MTAKAKGRSVLLVVYLVAIGGAIAAGASGNYSILLRSAIAVISAVAIIFLGSMICNNSSVFDPYWSIAPPLMVAFYFVAILQSAFIIHAPGYVMRDLWAGSPRIGILFILTLIYAIRLTWNFLRGWPGLMHEDWRYAGFRENTGKAYWLVSFSGIHFFPALMVFGGTLSIWVTVVQGFRPLNMVDLAALLVTGGGILLEAVADRQLRSFVAENRENGRTMDKGLWALSRHPNYLGEILFWWGLWLFALAANPSFWWVIIGPVAISLMFVFASIPMIEKRLLRRRKNYDAYIKKVSMLIPVRLYDRRENG